jgi:hypothetical protein
MFNATVDEAVGDLIGRATIALWNAEEIFHLADCDVRHAKLRSGFTYARQTGGIGPLLLKVAPVF